MASDAHTKTEPSPPRSRRRVAETRGGAGGDVRYKPDVGGDNVYVEDMWPELAQVKFEPAVELDPRQALGEDTDDKSL